MSVIYKLHCISPALINFAISNSRRGRKISVFLWTQGAQLASRGYHGTKKSPNKKFTEHGSWIITHVINIWLYTLNSVMSGTRPTQCLAIYGVVKPPPGQSLYSQKPPALVYVVTTEKLTPLPWQWLDVACNFWRCIMAAIMTSL